MSIRMRLREERAQATVEIAVVTPVLLVLALIVYNVMIFASAVARFDRVVPDIVLAHAVAPSGEGDESSVDASATVRTQILNAMEGYDLQIDSVDLSLSLLPLHYSSLTPYLICSHPPSPHPHLPISNSKPHLF